MKKSTISAMLVMCACLTAQIQVQAQDKVTRKIIEEGKSNNLTMVHEDFLANRIGGRPVGSHALEDAEEWVIGQLESWGIEVKTQTVGELPVCFNRGPWYGRLVGDKGFSLHFTTPVYSAGTKGPQKGHAVMEPKTIKQLEAIKGKLKGAWVLVDTDTKGHAIDYGEKANTERAKAIASGDKEALAKISVPFYQEMKEAGVLGFIQSVKAPLFNRHNRNCWDMTMDNLPDVCDIRLDSEQYDILKSRIERKEECILEFDIRNHFTKGPVRFRNVFGIIRGSKYPDQYVMSGAHLDSYDFASGAVDDGSGVSVLLESARLLACSGAKPLRTIVFCFWTAEENGIKGSRFFVENKTVPLENISNYFNRDHLPFLNTGVTVPEAMFEDFQKVCAPLAGIHPEFDFTVNLREGDPKPRKGGGSDYAYFELAGVPVIRFHETDPKGYGLEYSEVWHTDLDNYTKVIPEYLEHSATVQAVVLYGLANLKHLLSREGLYAD